MDLTEQGAGAGGHEGQPERRRSRRRPLPGVFVAIEAPEISEEQCWAGSALDINGDGLSLSLPAGVEPGTRLLLTFRLDGSHTFSRVPSVVVRKEPGAVESFGAVRFEPWGEQERLELISYLLGE